MFLCSQPYPSLWLVLSHNPFHYANWAGVEMFSYPAIVNKKYPLAISGSVIEKGKTGALPDYGIWPIFTFIGHFLYFVSQSYFLFQCFSHSLLSLFRPPASSFTSGESPCLGCETIKYVVLSHHIV